MKNRDGFTLSEMLMTVLIISLVVILLGGGTVVIKTAYDKVTARAEAQTILSTAVTKVSDEFRYATVYEDNNTSGPQRFKSGLSNVQIWFENGDKEINNSEKTGILICRANTDSEGGIDKIQLLTDETMAENLVPEIEYSYDENKGVFTAKISVKRDNNTFASQTINIRPVNK